MKPSSRTHFRGHGGSTPSVGKGIRHEPWGDEVQREHSEALAGGVLGCSGDLPSGGHLGWSMGLGRGAVSYAEAMWGH